MPGCAGPDAVAGAAWRWNQRSMPRRAT